MTNEKIILNESIKLMNAGLLKGTGVKAMVEIGNAIQEVEMNLKTLLYHICLCN